VLKVLFGPPMLKSSAMPMELDMTITEKINTITCTGQMFDRYIRGNTGRHKKYQVSNTTPFWTPLWFA
jgi:hypothetical protein